MHATRIVVVTIGLLIAGILAGALAGAVAGSVVLLTIGGDADDLLRVAVGSAWIGGVLGSVLGPLAAWGLLRAVPLGRLFAETAVGAAAGGLLGMFVFRPLLLRLEIAWSVLDWSPLIGGVLGFSAAVVHLRLRARRGAVRVEASSNPAT